ARPDRGALPHALAIRWQNGESLGIGDGCAGQVAERAPAGPAAKPLSAAKRAPPNDSARLASHACETGAEARLADRTDEGCDVGRRVRRGAHGADDCAGCGASPCPDGAAHTLREQM